MNKTIRSLFVLFFTIALAVSAGSAQQKTPPPVREMDFDEAGSEDALNRQLWENRKGSSYEIALEHIERLKRKSKRSAPATVTLPNGWQIDPAGRQTEVGRLPFEATVFAGQIVVLNNGYYSKESQEVSVVDPGSGRLMKILRLPATFPSAAVSGDTDLYISGGTGRKIYRFNRSFEQVREYAVPGYVGGIAALDGERLAVTYLVTAKTDDDFQKGYFQKGRIAVLNTASGTIERETEVGYFPHSVRFLNGKLYVTVAGEDKLLVFDAQLNPLKSPETGKLPQNSCTDGRRLFVVNANSDDVSVIDPATDKLTATISVKWRSSAAGFGSAPTSCAAAGDRLYVAQADTNTVAVYDLKNARPLGLIPTGWYPTKVIFADDRLLVVSAKGIRPLRPNVDGPQPALDKGGGQYVLTLLKGSLASIPAGEIEKNLARWTRQAESASPLGAERKRTKPPVRHIFYIVRENRTYDQVLGDLPRADGDRFLTLFGADVTPVAHRLSESFVTFDNYFADGEISVLGHSFTTSGYASPFLEWLGNNAYSGRYAGYPFGMVPAVTSPDYLWDALDSKKLSYRIYGENYFLYTRAYRILRETFGAEHEITRRFYAQMMNYAGRVDRGNIFYQFAKPYYDRTGTPAEAEKLLTEPEFAGLFSRFLCGDDGLVAPLAENAGLRRRFAEYLAHYPANYRSWDLNVSDLDRFAAWKTDFERQLRAGDVAALNYLWLPNDHTGGTDNRYLPPAQLVAQNDAALGLIVDTIAKSPIWKDSLILVTEDDAQNGPDHVDATRTVALAVGPYVKRKTVVHDRYDQLSLLRTIETLLDFPPLNLNDALAVPMYGIFTEKPDFAPVEIERVSGSLSDADRVLYQNLKAGGK
ncbi:MAG: bifunctional YncE family protein/alkaline phosphatase family protein [Acidobacteria bacterium]|nr:bifunctional YncE family protein/alkaline phosphatase family protein [Acidobacteriota bacterium]